MIHTASRVVGTSVCDVRFGVHSCCPTQSVRYIVVLMLLYYKFASHIHLYKFMMRGEIPSTQIITLIEQDLVERQHCNSDPTLFSLSIALLPLRVDYIYCMIDLNDYIKTSG